MRKPKRILGIAFWKYDIFPYWVSAEYTARAGDEVYITGYESWHNPEFVLSVEQGNKLRSKLRDLANNKRVLISQINEAYNALVKDAIQKRNND
jgi:hypothetical protein